MPQPTGTRAIGSGNAALALLNARLGVWLPNPTYLHEMQERLDPPGGERVFIGYRNLGYSLKEVFGVYDPLDRFVYVSDGGHHDNLGLIELLRRRCRVIVCFDASGDKAHTANTFKEVRARAGGELGVNIAPLDEHEDEDLLKGVRRVAAYKVVYPKLAPPPGVVGETLNAEEGRLVFAKCALVNGEKPVIAGEPVGRFPRDSTANQWFSSNRLAAYRGARRKSRGERGGAVDRGTGSVRCVSSGCTASAARRRRACSGCAAPTT